MRKTAFLLSFFLLLFNGIGALYGGSSLLADPSGEDLRMSVSVLQHTPFADFLLPGIALLLINGLGSFLVIFRMIVSPQRCPFWLFAEGCLLTTWIVVQALWTQVYHPWQAIMAAIGLVLMACGYFLSKDGVSNRSTINRYLPQ